jgi:hypothetical protein
VLEPHPQLVYAQLIKEKKRGRLHALSERLCCGATRLATLGLNWFVPRNSLEKVKALPTLIEYESFGCFWG